MSRNDEEKAVSVVSFISSSLWYIEDFSITDERKITNVTQRKHATKIEFIQVEVENNSKFSKSNEI
jgi:hypothetical protein